MFNDDEVRSALTKMYEYSPLDGFVEISEGLGSMIKSLAYEPSVGLFYVQQHAHKAVPNVVNLRNNIVVKSREISLHTEDSEDSITMVRSMKDCGFPIVDDMINDITKSLAIMSLKQPRKGLISSSSWGRTAWRGNVNDVQRSSTYSSVVFESREELPVSSCVLIGDEEEDVLVDKLKSELSRSGNFDEFRDDKEARFVECLEGNDTKHRGSNE